MRRRFNLDSIASKNGYVCLCEIRQSLCVTVICVLSTEKPTTNWSLFIMHLSRGAPCVCRGNIGSTLVCMHTRYLAGTKGHVFRDLIREGTGFNGI